MTLDTDLDADALRELTAPLPRASTTSRATRASSCERAILAVFDSWMGERAVAYRRINGIPDDWGTAVNVQQMVFGNTGDTSGSGVAFTRDEVTGAPEPQRRLPRQRPGRGRRVGRAHAARPLGAGDWMPEVARAAARILRTLERHYKDMQDTEFTVEEGRLYMLQTRNAKRPAQAAVRFAVDAVDEGLLTPARRSRRSTPPRWTRCCIRRSHPTREFDVHRPRRGGVAGCGQGRDRLHAQDAVAGAAAGAT